MPKKDRPNPEHVFEGTTISLAVTADKDLPQDIKKAKFLFTKVEDGSESQLDPIEVDITSKTREIRASLDVPLVGDTAESYRLFYTLEVGEKKIPQGEVWVVWRPQFGITTKCEVDGELKITGCPTLILNEHGGKETRHDMPFSGKRIILMTTPGPFTIDLQAPAKLKSWTAGKDKGKERELEFEVAPSLVKVLSPAEGGVNKAYVNDGDNAVMIGFKTTDPDGNLDIPNQDVFFEVKFTNPTIRRKGAEKNGNPDYAAEATVLDNGGAVTFSQRGTPKSDETTWKGQLKSDFIGLGMLSLYLGKGGGETCEVKLGSTKTCEDATLKFETWRRLYVKYWHTNTDLTKNGWLLDKREQTTKCYEKGFVEITYLEDGVLIPDEVVPANLLEVRTKKAWFDPDRSDWYPGAEFGLKPERILVLNTEGDSWKKMSAGLLADHFGDKAGLFINVMLPDHAIAYNPYFGKVTIKAAELGADATKGNYLQKYKGKDVLLFHKTGLQAEPGDEDAHFDLLPTKNMVGKKLTDAKVRVQFASFVIRVPGGRDSDPLDISDTVVFEYDKKEKENDKLVRGHVRIVFPEDTKKFFEAPAKSAKDLVVERDKLMDEIKENQRGRAPFWSKENSVKKELVKLEEELVALQSPSEPNVEVDVQKVEEKEKAIVTKKEELLKATQELEAHDLKKQPKMQRVNAIIGELEQLPSIELDYNVLMVNESPAAGISNGKDAIVLERVSKLFEESKWKEINNTVCHEIGHAIGMAHAIDQLQPGSGYNRFPGYATALHDKAKKQFFVLDAKADPPQPLHPRWYHGRGHTGTHCAEGLGQTDYDKWGDLSGVTIKNIKTFKCVIYGQSTFATPVEFCDNCLKILRAMDVWTGEKET